MAVVFKNNAKTTLASNLSSSATSIAVADGSVFPSLGSGEIFFCTLDDGTNNEIVKVTAISSNTLTVVRAQESTTARAFSTGDAADLRLTAGILGLFSQTGVAVTDEIEAYLDANGLTLPDNVKAQFGAGSDLQIYHDGTTNNSVIKETGAGHLELWGNNVKIMNVAGTETQLDANPNGAVTLYHDNNPKIATTSQGIQVTNLIQAEQIQLNATGSNTPQIQLNNNDFGTFDWLVNQADTGKLVITVSGTSGAEMELSSDGSDYTNAILTVGGQKVLTQTAGINLTGNLGFNDNVKAQFGASNDLKIFHDQTNSINYIQSFTSNELRLESNGNTTIRTNNGDNMAVFTKNGAATLYHDNNPKIATTSTGISVTGGITATTSLSLNGSTIALDTGNDYMEFNKALFSPIGYFVGTTGTKVGHLQNSAGVFYMEAATARQIAFGNETNGEFVRIDATGNTTFTGSIDINSDSGQLQFGADNDMQIFHNGANGEINNATGNFTIDSAQDIVLDADNADIFFKDNGTLFMTANSANGLIIGTGEVNESIRLDHYSSAQSDITGLVGGSTFGSIIYGGTNGHIVMGLRDNDAADSFSVVSGSGNYMTDSTFDSKVFSVRADGQATFSGTINSGAITTSGTLTVDAGSSGMIDFGDVTSAYGRLYADSSGTYIGSKSNHNLILRSNHIAALTLDTSQNATFAGDITLANDKDIHFLKADGTNDGTRLTRAGGNAVRFKFGGNSLIFDSIEDTDFRVYNSGGDTIFLIDSNSTATSSAVNVAGSFKVGGTRRITNAGVLENVTTATASAGTNTTALANTAFVQQEITSLIGGAPGTLDTLNELAAAINDDSNYNSTLTTALATKLPSASYTAADVLTKVKTVDGSGSGLDADLLDGIQASQFIRNDTGSVPIARFPTTALYGDDSLGAFASSTFAVNPPRMGFFNINNSSAENPAGFGYWQGLHFRHNNQSSTWGWQLAGTYNTSYSDLYFRQVASASRGSWYKLWHTGNDGSGSGLDADLLDGQHGSYYRNASNINAGTINTARLPNVVLLSGGNAILKLQETDQTNNPTWWHVADGGNYSIRLNNTGGYPFQITTNSTNNAVSGIALNYATTIQGNTAWHAGNDGSGSGLDADTLDGVNSGSFLRSDATDSATGALTFSGSILSNGHSSGSNYLPYTDGNFYFRAPNVFFDSTQVEFNNIARVVTGSVAASNTTKGLMFDGNYQTGQYRHRFRKQDLNGGLPLFLDISEGTANSYTAIARFGPYLNNTQKFEVYGNSRFDGDVEVGVLTTTDSGVLYLNGSTANKRAELSCSNGNLHIDADNGNGIYLNWYGSQSATSTAGTYFGNANSGQVARIDGSGNFTLSGTVDGVDIAARNSVLTSTTTTANAALPKAGGTMTGTLTTGGNIVVPSNTGFQTSGTETKFTTTHGFIQLGPMNTSYAHIYTNIAGGFYFNKNNIYANGNTMWTSGNDGSGSGLDADLLDGQQGSYYAPASGANYEPINATILHRGSDISSADWNTFIDGTEASWNTVLNHSGSNRPVGYYTYGTVLSFSKSGQAKFQLYASEQASGGNGGLAYRTGWNTTYRAWVTLWDSGNDGSGSGLDADLLDGLHASSFLRLDSGSASPQGVPANRIKRFNSQAAINTTSGSQSSLEVYGNNGAGTDAFMTFHVENDYALYFGLDGGTNDLAVGGWSKGANSYKVWHAGNDGASSGLDADTVDGTHLASIYSNSAVANTSVNKVYENSTITYGASYLQWLDNSGTGGTGLNGAQPGNPFSDWHHHIVMNHGNSNGYYVDIAASFHHNRVHFRRLAGNNSPAGWNEFWHTGNDGSGSGLDADTVDGIQGSSFLRSDTADTKSGHLTLAGDTKILFNNTSNYGIGAGGHNYNSGYFDTVESGTSTDPLELVYYQGRGVNIGQTASLKNLGCGGIKIGGADNSIASGYMLHLQSTGDAAILLEADTDNVTESDNPKLRFRQDGGAVEAQIMLTANNDFMIDHIYTANNILFSFNGSTKGTITNAGNLTMTGNVTAYSDERLKENIQTLDSKKALQMRGVSFVKGGVKGSGVIAQEIEEIAPELVLTADDEMGTKSVAYGNLVGYLIEAIKDQQKQIDELKEKNDIILKENNYGNNI